MKPVVIYVHALLIYLLITLPTIVVPFMYILSAIYAFVFGFASCGVFVFTYLIVKHFNPPLKTSYVVLNIAVPVAVAVGHTTLGVFSPDLRVWAFNFFLCFPLAAVIAGWISLYCNRRSVAADLTGEIEQEIHIVI